MPVKGKGRAKSSKNQHKLCKPLPNGEVLTDLQKKSWKIGKPIGSGGFGLIYTADESSEVKVSDDAPYVIKVEPHGNGPLYSEIAFYQRVARSNLMEEWKKNKKLSMLPIPAYIAHGLHTHDGESLRFLVMPRFGSDLHKLWLKANKKFKRETVAKVALTMLDGLEYLHGKMYVHADIKGSNILCDMFNKKEIYLVDYGLASRYIVDGQHKQYKPDPRKAHDGTIEYTSTDAHDGTSPSRRGDLEILGLFLLHLIAGRLPWEDKLNDPKYVAEQKKKHLKHPEKFVNTSCGSPIPEISKLLQTATDLAYDEEPNYDEIRGWFLKALKTLKVSVNSTLDFSNPDKTISFESPSPVNKRKTRPQKRKNVTPHPVKTKSRKQTTASEDQASSSEESSEVLSERRSSAHKSPRLSVSDENFPVKPKPRSATRRRKIQKVVSSTSEETTDQSFNDVCSMEKKNSLKTKQKVKGATSRRAPLATKEVDGSPVEPKTIYPKFSRPPLLNTPKTRNTSRRKPAVLSSDSESSDSSGDDEEPVSHPKSPNTRSRYSMAPLHTEPVLTANEQLTGKYSGKHPVFMRRRKKNISKNDACTQTTPTLRRTSPRKQHNPL